MRRIVLLVTSVLVFATPLVLSAQSAATIAPGDTVRLSAKSLATVDRIGILVSVEGDKLMLVDADTTRAAWEIALDRVTRLEVRRPTAGNHKHRGALIGMITGFVVLGGAPIRRDRFDAVPCVRGRGELMNMPP